MRKRVILSVVAVSAVVAGQTATAQQKRISPHETISAVINGNRVTITYGRPYSKDPKSDKIRKIWGELVPWGRIGLPQDCGYVAAFLLSDASEFMTGHVLYFDGGLTAKMALPFGGISGQDSGSGWP